MTTEIEKWAWRQDIGGSHKLVLLSLAKRADWDTLECYPSQALIARETGLSLRCVRGVIRDLDEEHRLIAREAREGTSDIITLMAPDLVAPAGDSTRRPRQITSCNPGKLRHATPAESAAELTIEPTNRTKARERADDLFDEDEVDDLSPRPVSPAKFLFVDWWAVYPRKKARGAAERAFAKAIKLIPVDQLIAKTRLYAASVASKDKEFLPYPATWLNAKSWDDEDLKAPPPRPTGAADWF